MAEKKGTGKSAKTVKNAYSVPIRVFIFLVAIFYLIGAFDAFLEVADGEANWTAMQTFRVVFSFILAFAYAYVACFTRDFDRRFKLGLEDFGRFLFLLFVLFVILVLFMMAVPAH